MRILLWALQSPINIGMILRTAEAYRIEAGIFDQFGVLSRPEATATVSDFACGALQRRPPIVLLQPDEARRFATARTVATAITGDATPVQAFRFQPDDCLVVGNEYDGLPETLLAEADRRVTIPMPPGYLPKPLSTNPIDPARRRKARDDGTPSLNVAVASSILMFMAFAQAMPATASPASLPGRPHGGDR